MEALRVSNKPNAREPQPLSEQGDRKTDSVASKPEKPVSKPISGNRNTETNAAKLLQSDVYRTVRANDRKAVIKTLQESFYLRNIPLNQKCGRDGTPLTTESAGQPQWGELETEVFKSNVILNGISLCGNNAKSAFYRNRFPKVMKELCTKLAVGLPPAGDDKGEISGLSLYHDLIGRLAKSSSLADIHSELKAVLGNPDLILIAENKENDKKQEKPKSKSRYARMMEAQKVGTNASPPCSPPSECMVYQAEKQIHASLTVSHLFGLYRKTDVALHTPWIYLVAAVHERVNLSTGDSVRYIACRVADQVAKSDQ